MRSSQQPYMKKLFVFTIIFIAGCGVQRKYEDYRMQREADLTLTSTNHSHGWQRAHCFHCHVRANIHEVNRINSPVFGLAKTLVETQGLESCSTCHGENGLR